MESIAGLTAAITGGGSGIGRGIGLACARAGANVVVLDIRAQAAEEAAALLGSEAKGGARAIGVTCDVTDPGSLDAARERALEAFGSVNLLSANAGVLLPNAPTTEQSDDDWRYVFEVNLFGVVGTVRAFLPALRAARERGEPAHIVNTASAAGLLSATGMGVGIYSATKMGVVGYSEALRGELEAEGIGVSALCPGYVPTQLGRTSAENRPQRFGGPRQGDLREAPAAMLAIASTPEEVGQRVVDGILANRTYIYDTDLAAGVEARFQLMLSDMKAQVGG